MYPITVKNSNGDNVVFNVVSSRPTSELTAEIKSFLSDFPSDKQSSEGSALVGNINQAMKNVAIDSIINSDDILKSLASAVTYGCYTVKPGENNRGYALSNFDKKVATVKTGAKNAEGKAVKEERPLFIDYGEFMRRVAELDRLNKKKQLPLVKLNGELPGKYEQLLTMLANAMTVGLSADDIALIEKWGTPFTALLQGESEKYENWIVRFVQGFYDLLNARTGKSYKIIKPVVFDRVVTNGEPVFVNRILLELRKYRSKTRTESDNGNTGLFTIILNEYINTGVAVAKHSKIKTVSEVFKTEEKTEEVKPTENTVVSGLTEKTEPVAPDTVKEVQTDKKKQVMVTVEPSCISADRELQYMEEVAKAYESGTLSDKMEVVEETSDVVKIVYHR